MRIFNCPLDILETDRCTFMNAQLNSTITDEQYSKLPLEEKKKYRWPAWKQVKDCTPEELLEINLITPNPKYIILDKDMHGCTDLQIKESYDKTKYKLIRTGILSFIGDLTPNGYHIFIPCSNLAQLDPEVQKEIRNIYIKEYDMDKVKNTSFSAISIPGRPHFKTMQLINKVEVEEVPAALELELHQSLIKIATNNVEERNKLNKEMQADDNFKDYFEKDIFFNYIKNNVIPDNTGRDMVIFPNLAIAAIKTGKSLQEIKDIMEPILKKNFPGKNWAEFYGWLKKAQEGKITTYNKYQLNQWSKTFGREKKDVYDLRPMEIEILKNAIDLEVPQSTRIKLYWNDEIDSLSSKETEWIIKDWLPKGDIAFIAGKSGSYKTTMALNFALAIANGKQVFEKYDTLKAKVLYINEENKPAFFKKCYSRIKLGLDLEKVENFALSQEENIKLDMTKKSQEDISDIEALADIIIKNNIEVVVFDSLRRFFAFDENDANKISDLFDKLKKLRKICGGITIILIHHVKKTPLQGNVDIKDMLRGSSDMINAADSVIVVQRIGTSQTVEVCHAKLRDATEMGKRRIAIMGEKDSGISRLVEVAAAEELEETKSGVDKCSDKIYDLYETLKVRVMSVKQISEKLESLDGTKYNVKLISRALKKLEAEGLMTKSGNGMHTKWSLNGVSVQRSLDSKEEKEDEIEEEEEHENDE